jgi:hypothetical protein
MATSKFPTMKEIENENISKKDKKMNRMSQQRFGHNVEFEKY